MLNLSTWIPNLTSEEHARLKIRLNVILYTLLGVSVVLLQLQNPINRAAAIIGVIMLLISLWLVRHNYLSIPRIAVPLVFWLVMTTFAANGAGLRDASIYGYFIVIMMSGLLLGENTIWMAMGVSILSVFGIFFAKENGIIQTSYSYHYSEAIYLTSYLIIATILLRMVISNLNKSLLVARQNEQALATLNTELEGRVQRRTRQAEEARREAELMYKIAGKLNSSLSYSEILQIITDELGPQPFTISLNIHEHFDLNQARYVETVGIVPAGQTQVLPLNVQTPVDTFQRTLLDYVIDNLEAPHVQTELRDFFLPLGIKAICGGTIRIGERLVGSMAFTVDQAHQFSLFERNLLRGLTDLIAASTERSRLFQEVEASRQQTEKLFQAGRSINTVNSYVELVNAIATYLNNPSYDVVISTYENFDKAGANHYTLLVGKIAGEAEAQMLGVDLPVLEGFTIAIDELYTDADVAAHPEDVRSVYLQAQGIVSAMAVGLYVGKRYLGNLSISTREPHLFSQEEGQLLLGLADLTAAAVDRIHLYDDQVKTAEDLRALDMMKSQFLASMSHELRTPLNAILNFTEFMLVGMLGPTTDKQKDALHKTLGSGKHLLSLINDVLDMTKIQSDMMNLFIEDQVDLGKELHQVIATTESMLNGRPVQFVQEISPDLPKVVGDKRRIRQILLNLLSNAAKFTEQGSITLKACTEGDHVLFSVIDTGPGIAPEDQDLIFEPFRQTDAGIQHAGGTGLGLPISRKLAEAHGGTLSLESQPGQGAAFHVRLPIRSTALLAMISHPEIA